MLSESFATLFSKNIQQVKTEIESYSNSETIWKVAEGTNNSAGNLALHLAGNLQHFLGAVLNNSGYKRDREFEFSGKVTTEKLLKELDATLQSVSETFANITPERMKENYPDPPFDREVSCEEFLLHLYGHLNYHLGQINYHRRMLDH